MATRSGPTRQKHRKKTHVSADVEHHRARLNLGPEIAKDGRLVILGRVTMSGSNPDWLLAVHQPHQTSSSVTKLEERGVNRANPAYQRRSAGQAKTSLNSSNRFLQ